MPVADLPPLDFAARLGRLRAGFAEAACDALVVTSLVNVRYLTGFTGSNATLLVTDERLVLVTDSRYRTQAAEQLETAGVEAEVVIENDPAEALRVGSRGITRIGLEADDVSWATQRRWSVGVFPWAYLVPTEDMILDLRSVKDEGEVARLRAASSIADRALADVRERAHDGLTERAFRRLLEDAMVDHGSDGPSFETIVASGPNGAMPHARPSDRVIGSSARGEFVVVDFGATVDGYHSDMTRTLAVGSLSPEQERQYDVVRRAQRAGVEKVNDGVGCRDVDRACRDLITDEGWGEEFGHGTGHGIGLVIHELPRLSGRSDDILEVGNCVTVEPGVYLPGRDGVRIEDSMVVTEDGCSLLTHAPYE